MSTARSATGTAPDEVAAAICDAAFVRICARADGASLAGAGLLARACRAIGTPFQVRLARDPSSVSFDESDLTVTVGATGGAVTLTTQSPETAYSVARSLGADPDPVLGLAGVVAAGRIPGGEQDGPLDAAQSVELVDRRLGVSIPTADLADGLAHSTLLHAPFSGDEGRTRDALSALDEGTQAADAEDALDDPSRRRLASLVALRAVGDASASTRSASAIERALRPYATDAPFATVGGYADVLSAVACERPGTGVALALGHDASEAALSAWRDHARAVHALVREGDAARHDGVFVVTVGADEGDSPVRTLGRLATAARLVRDFRAPEPVALVVGEGVAAAASVDDRDLGATMRRAADATDDDGTGNEDVSDDRPVGYGTARTGEARYVGDRPRFVEAVREAL